ncbi:MAG: DUF4097 family beta strand repeat-containing protein [Gemmatimonadaceae bacterium]
MRPHTTILAALCLAVTACSHGGSDDHAFQWNSELPPGATVHLRNGSGEIQVRPATGQSVAVSGSRTWRHGRAGDVHFVVTRSGNDYYVCAMWRNSGSCNSRGYRGKNTGGFLAMFSLFHRTSDATAGLVADIPSNVTVDAKTSIGSVKIEGIAAGVTAHSANGDIEATNVSGPLTLATANGNVRLSADAVSASDPINLSTTNGTIRAQLPPGTEGNFDLSVINGIVRSDFPLTQTGKSAVGGHLRGQIGTSNRVVKMHTVNGEVVVTRSGAATHE